MTSLVRSISCGLVEGYFFGSRIPGAEQVVDDFGVLLEAVIQQIQIRIFLSLIA
jgi:hypothetical protein